MAKLLIRAAVLAAALASPAVAELSDAAASGLCLDAIRGAEARHGTPPGLLAAIARTESGRPVQGMPGLQPWPWAVNADGQAFYGADKASAVAWARAAQARGVRFMDVGCAQVNLHFHPTAFRDLDEAFDPGANADYAARFLGRLAGEADGNWHAATGYYHSRTPALAEGYRERVAAIAAGRTPPRSAFQPLYLRAIRQGSLRFALAGGGAFIVNVNRQPSSAGRRRMSACQVMAVLAPLLSAPARARSCNAASARPTDATSGISMRKPLS